MKIIHETHAEMVFEEKNFVLTYAGMVTWFPFAWLLSNIPELRTVWIFLALVFVLGIVLPLRGLWYERLELDLQMKSFSYRRGLWPIIRRRRGSFSELNGVAISAHTTKSDAGWSWKDWELHLPIANMRAKPKLGWYKEEATARRDFEHYSRQLRLPALDRTGRVEHVTKPEEWPDGAKHDSGTRD